MDWTILIPFSIVAGILTYAIVKAGWDYRDHVAHQEYLKDPEKWYRKRIRQLTWKIGSDMALIGYYRSQVDDILEYKKRDKMDDWILGEELGVVR